MSKKSTVLVVLIAGLCLLAVDGFARKYAKNALLESIDRTVGIGAWR